LLRENTGNLVASLVGHRARRLHDAFLEEVAPMRRPQSVLDPVLSVSKLSDLGFERTYKCDNTLKFLIRDHRTNNLGEQTTSDRNRPRDAASCGGDDVSASSGERG